MAKKIFVSYKHQDSSVRPMANIFGEVFTTTARHYVDEIIDLLSNDIYKGEGDEDLSRFKDETIQTKLKDKIFDSSITIVLISKNMFDPYEKEENQWIPWEISYSLREKSRDGKTSKPNGFLAVVLPDENNSYEYFVTSSGCAQCNSTSWKNDSLFHVLGKNMFNRKSPNLINCTGGVCGSNVHTGDDHSYIYPVLWDSFVKSTDYYLNHALNIRENIDDYEIIKKVVPIT